MLLFLNNNNIYGFFQKQIGINFFEEKKEKPILLSRFEKLIENDVNGSAFITKF